MKIDWAYLRKGWSCTHAQEFLENTSVTMEEFVDARKVRIDEDAAWEMLKSAKSITAAKGKKVLRFNRVSDEKEAVLKQVMGPSGNLRAPTYRVGDDFTVGFNLDLYTEWIK